MNIKYTIDTTQTQTYKCTGGYRYDMDYCNTVLLDTVKSQLSSTFLKVLYNSLRVFELLSHKPQAPPPQVGPQTRVGWEISVIFYISTTYNIHM